MVPMRLSQSSEDLSGMFVYKQMDKLHNQVELLWEFVRGLILNHKMPAHDEVSNGILKIQFSHVEMCWFQKN